MKSREFLFARECDIGYITPGAGLAADSFTKIIGNDEVKSGSSFHLCGSRIIAQVNPVEHLDEPQDANLNSHFFPQFSNYSFFQTFTELQRAARNGPITEQRLATAADPQRPALIDNSTSAANHGPFARFSR